MDSPAEHQANDPWPNVGPVGPVGPVGRSESNNVPVTSDPAAIVREFLEVVRSGSDPAQAGRFMASTVRAHQVQSEYPRVVERTPQQYAEHVEEMIGAYGRFSFEIDQLFAGGDKVYARWTPADGFDVK